MKALGAAADDFVATFKDPGTVRVYHAALRPIVEHFGPNVPVDQIDPSRLAAWFGDYWGDAKASTWRVKRNIVRQFFGYCRERGWSGPMAAALIDMCPSRLYPPDPRFAARVAAMIADTRFGLRERALWGVVYDGAAKVREVLALDVPVLDLTARSARTPSGVISWTAATNSLLAELLAGRNSGPVFLTRHAACRLRTLDDLDAATGRSRLSFKQAEGLIKKATGDHPDGHVTFRQLRQGSDIPYGWMLR